mmetsp:Transcript_12770/g.37185  ORF Transcript_12770/g.37185 Transcript_12770/m.37185 type:complete len:249 (+) Transcript_12770:128-874(+)
MGHCVVLPGFYGILVQGLLFLVVVCILVYKKVNEGAQRTWFEFCLDSSKQCMGAGWIHVLNLAFATIMAQYSRGDECEWYWVNIMIDTTVGVAFEYFLLWLITAGLDRLLQEGARDYHTGEYWVGEEFQMVRYMKQLMVWLLVVTLMKLAVLGIMAVCKTPLIAAAAWILRPFLKTPWIKLLVVMILTPLIMNAFQFWVTDNFIKKHRNSCESGKRGGCPLEGNSNELESLLRGPAQGGHADDDRRTA